MSTTTRKTDPKFKRAYERAVLRSAFVSLFWGIINERRKRGGFTLQGLAGAVGSSKSEVSRWFNGDPNWTVNTIANIADALDVDLKIEATDRVTGMIYTPAGVVYARTTSPQGVTATKPANEPTVTIRSSRTKVGVVSTSTREAA
jgi:transcriptional regulator with XRE-family HTH domain